MTRGELERLDREALILRAQAIGVDRARILTRPELVDELLLRSATDDATKEKSRGLFGRARDLLARLVERGLNKPDTADRIRAVGRAGWRAISPTALPTLTLAEIYVAQGYRERAMETLERVLSAEPEHAEARALLSRLRDAAFPVPAPKMPPEAEEDEAHDSATPLCGPASPVPAAEAAPRQSPEPAPEISSAAPAPEPSPTVPAIEASSQARAPEPAYMLDDSPLPTRYDVDECVAICVDPRTLYVYWEVRDVTLRHLRARLPAGSIVLRIVVVEPSWTGPRETARDHDVAAAQGDFFVSDLPSGSLARAAIGLRSGAEFEPVAHSAAVETPRSGPFPLAGREFRALTLAGAEPVSAGDSHASAIVAAADRIRKDSASAWRQTRPLARVPGPRPLGASEHLSARRP